MCEGSLARVALPADQYASPFPYGAHNLADLRPVFGWAEDVIIRSKLIPERVRIVFTPERLKLLIISINALTHEKEDPGLPAPKINSFLTNQRISIFRHPQDDWSAELLEALTP